jgi:hypothetical protein
MLHRVGECCGFLLLSDGRRRRVLVRQVTRMPHHTPERRRDDASIAVLNLNLLEHAVPIPAARRFVLGPPGLVHQQGQGGLLASPGVEVLPDGTGARD